jgi:hypothetical protein
VYYINTAQKLFMRVRIDPDTFEPISVPERLASGGMYDDFCIDDEKGVAYLTVHRENRIDRAPLEPDQKRCNCSAEEYPSRDATRFSALPCQHKPWCSQGRSQ